MSFTLDSRARDDLIAAAAKWSSDSSNDRAGVDESLVHDVEAIISAAIGRIEWRLEPGPPAPRPPEFSPLTVAEVRAVERDKTVLLLSRQIAQLKTTEPSSSRSFGRQSREAAPFKAEVMSILDSMMTEDL